MVKCILGAVVDGGVCQFTLQTDMSRRQLEFEARQIRSAMEEQLGSCQEMERRAQVR